MFQSYTDKYIGYSNYQHSYEFTIIDNDFQEIIKTNEAYFATDIIRIYSRRNLNVALNLFLFMQYQNKKHGDWWSIDEQISMSKKDVKDFEKYLPELKKYLALI